MRVLGDRRVWLGFAALGALAGGAITVSLARESGDRPASPVPPVAATATVSASVPTAVSTPTATPDGSPPIIPLAVREDGEFPPGTAVLVATRGYGHGGGYFRVQRFWRLVDGPVQSDTDLPREFEDGVITGIEASPNGTVYASVCRPLQCGTEGDPPKDTLTQYYRSDDGGMSWNYSGARSGRWWIRAATDDDAFAVSFEGQGRVFAGVMTHGAVAAPAEAGVDADPLVVGGELAWRVADEPVLLSSTGGDALRLPLPAGSLIADALLSLQGQVAASWSTPTSNGVRQLAVFVGGDTKAYAFPNGAPEPSAWLDARRLLVTAEVADRRPGACTTAESTGGAIGRAPAILDFGSNTLSFITQPFLPNGCALGTERPIAVYGATWRVTGTGFCLNIRQSPLPNADVVACVKDGVLLGSGGGDTDAGGGQWTPVTTPTGQRGWAANEFLARN